MLNSDPAMPFGYTSDVVEDSCSKEEAPAGILAQDQQRNLTVIIPSSSGPSRPLDRIISSPYHPSSNRSRSPSPPTINPYVAAANANHHPAPPGEAVSAATYAAASQLRMTSTWEDTADELLHKTCNVVQQHEEVMSFASTEDAVYGDFSDEYSFTTSTAALESSSTTSAMKILNPYETFGDDDKMDGLVYSSAVHSIMRPQEPPLSLNFFPDIKRANPIISSSADDLMAQNDITNFDNQGDFKRTTGRHNRTKPPISVLYLEHRLKEDNYELKKRMC